jgi:aminoethylphosphonate catabolism LysR family transcriptional regulator
MTVPLQPDGAGVNFANRAGRRDGSITLAGLRAFVAVVEAGGLSAAARALGVSQPNISVQLATLETACGVMLLHRRPRQALTEAGRDLLLRARLVLSRFDELEHGLSELRALRRGRLVVGLSTPAFAMPLIARFQQQHPGVTVTTRLGNTATLTESVAACDIDLAVMTLLEDLPGMACTTIARQRLVLCVPAGHPLATGRALRLPALAGLKLVMREPGSMTRRMLEQLLATAGLAPQIQLEVGSREAVKEAVAAGLGVGALLDGEVGEDPRLATVPLHGAAAVAEVAVVSLPESHELPAVAAFVGLARLATPIMKP